MRMTNRAQFWLPQARRPAAIITLLLSGALGNLSCRPARQAALPDGAALAALQDRSDLRLAA